MAFDYTYYSRRTITMPPSRHRLRFDATRHGHAGAQLDGREKPPQKRLPVISRHAAICKAAARVRCRHFGDDDAFALHISARATRRRHGGAAFRAGLTARFRCNAR